MGGTSGALCPVKRVFGQYKEPAYDPPAIRPPTIPNTKHPQTSISNLQFPQLLSLTSCHRSLHSAAAMVGHGGQDEGSRELGKTQTQLVAERFPIPNPFGRNAHMVISFEIPHSRFCAFICCGVFFICFPSFSTVAFPTKTNIPVLICTGYSWSVPVPCAHKKQVRGLHTTVYWTASHHSLLSLFQQGKHSCVDLYWMLLVYYDSSGPIKEILVANSAP